MSQGWQPSSISSELSKSGLSYDLVFEDFLGDGPQSMELAKGILQILGVGLPKSVLFKGLVELGTSMRTRIRSARTHE